MNILLKISAAVMIPCLAFLGIDQWMLGEKNSSRALPLMGEMEDGTKAAQEFMNGFDTYVTDATERHLKNLKDHADFLAREEEKTRGEVHVIEAELRGMEDQRQQDGIGHHVNERDGIELHANARKKELIAAELYLQAVTKERKFFEQFRELHDQRVRRAFLECRMIKEKMDTQNEKLSLYRARLQLLDRDRATDEDQYLTFADDIRTTVAELKQVCDDWSIAINRLQQLFQEGTEATKRLPPPVHRVNQYVPGWQMMAAHPTIRSSFFTAFQLWSGCFRGDTSDVLSVTSNPITTCSRSPIAFPRVLLVCSLG